jgi:adhesin transport system outer membrane protein
LFVAITVLASAPGARAETLSELIDSLVKNHRQIKAAVSDLDAAKERAEASWGDWYPTFDFTGNWGREKQNKSTGTEDSEGLPRELDFTITQQIWDFGSTNAGIRRSRLELERVNLDLMGIRQNLTLQGIEAYLNVIRAKRVLDFAGGSVDNIRHQTELEDSRVQRGGGFTTDVLQAKTQLAGAEARRNNFAGGLRTAINTFRRFFGKDPGKIEKLKQPRMPYELLPKTLDEVIRVMHQDNPALRASMLEADIMRQTLRQTRADELFPSINAVAEAKRKEDVGGTLGKSNEQLFKVEMTYSLNLGLTEFNTIRAARKDLLAATDRYIDARDSFEERARNTWSNFERNRLNAEFLKNQASISAEFLELARRERQLGNRSLIDVLAGETALINANSDATAAETDVMLDVFRLLNIMGQLEVNIVE